MTEMAQSVNDMAQWQVFKSADVAGTSRVQGVWLPQALVFQTSRRLLSRHSFQRLYAQTTLGRRFI